MAANVGDKLELDVFRPTVANKFNRGLFIFFPIDNMSNIFFHLGKKYEENNSKPCATLCSVFTMGGTVALRSVNKLFPESYSSTAM